MVIQRRLVLSLSLPTHTHVEATINLEGERPGNRDCDFLHQLHKEIQGQQLAQGTTTLAAFNLTHKSRQRKLPPLTAVLPHAAVKKRLALSSHVFCGSPAPGGLPHLRYFFRSARPTHHWLLGPHQENAQEGSLQMQAALRPCPEDENRKG